jgi:hypothetical protein
MGDAHGRERRMTVPAGSVIIKHGDVVHRRSRAGTEGSVEGVAYRPMFGLGGFSRRMEPAPGGCALAVARAPSAIPATAWLPSELAPGAPKVAVRLPGARLSLFFKKLRGHL